MNATTHPKRRSFLLALIGVLALTASVLSGVEAQAANNNTITGVVTLGSPGSPAGAGQVQVTLGYSATRTGPRVSDPSTAVLTDSTGRFTFASQPDGWYNVYFTAVGDIAGEYRSQTSDYLGLGHNIRGGVVYDAGLSLTRLITVAGRVTLGPDGASVGENEVEVTLSRSYVVNAPPLATTWTDADGYYRFEGVAALDAVLSFEHVDAENYPRYQALEIAVTGSSRSSDNWDVEIPFDPYIPPTLITGSVHNEAGDPLYQHPVWLTRVDPKTGARGWDYQTWTWSDGSFYIEVPEGSYEVAFGYVDEEYATELWRDRSPWDYTYRADLPRAHADLVYVEANTTTSGVDAIVGRGGAITGSVVGAGPLTVSTTWDFAATTVDVMVFDDSTARWVRTGHRYTVNPDGTYRIGSLEASYLQVGSLYPDTYRVVVEYDGPRGYSAVTSGNLVVGPGSATTFNATLRPASSAPVNTYPPRVAVSEAGVPPIGSTWRVDVGSWAGSPTLQRGWLRCSQPIAVPTSSIPAGCVVISGASGAEYVSTGADAGKYISAVITGSNGFGTVRAVASTTVAIEPPTAAAVTVVPTISGGAQVGTTWTLNPGTWSGTPTPTIVQAWLRCNQPVTTTLSSVPAGCAAISGANGLTYTSTISDRDKWITAQVAGINVAGSTNIVAFTQEMTAVPAPAVVGAPTVSGSAAVGSTWTLNPGTWNTATTRVVQAWLRCSSPVTAPSPGIPAGCSDTGASGLTYVSTLADAGKYLTAQVAGINAAGSTNTLALTTVATTGPTPPRVTVAPTVSGGSAVGSTWTLTPGAWSGTPAPRIVQAWLRCTSPVTTTVAAVPSGCVDTGATGLTYVSTAADASKYITAQVAGINSAGATNRVALTTVATAGPVAPAVTVAPTVSGSSAIGSTWTLTAGTWSGSPTPRIVQAWLRCNAPITAVFTTVPSGCVDTGVYGLTYVSTAADANKYLTAQVAGINAAGTVNTGAVQTVRTAGPTPPGITTGPSVTGNSAVGSTWTLNPGVWSGTPAPRVVQAWLRCNAPITAVFSAVPSGCVDTGSYGLTYVSTAADGGKYITAQVAGINSGGTVNTGAVQTVATAGPTAPGILTPPSLTGSSAIGSTWTLNPGVWSGTPTPRVVQAWLRCNAPITTVFVAVPTGCVEIGAYGLTYVSTAADGGKYITAQVAGINAAGAVNTGVVQAVATQGATAPGVLTSPSVTGNSAVGSVWTLNPGVWSGSPNPRVVQAWLRCDAPVTAVFGAVPSGCVDTGSYGLTYTSTAADLGKYVTAQVAGINSAGTVNTGVVQTVATG